MGQHHGRWDAAACKLETESGNERLTMNGNARDERLSMVDCDFSPEYAAKIVHFSGCVDARVGVSALASIATLHSLATHFRLCHIYEPITPFIVKFSKVIVELTAKPKTSSTE